MSEDFRQMALDYHRWPKPGKLSVTSTKKLANQLDLSLAYSPGVAAACESIAADRDKAADYTVKGNLVGVVSNGSAVLGLGAIGPDAAKPVMEGKAVLFKKFAGIDVFDIELDETDPHRLVEIICALEPTFGGINLEDIKAPECFVVERECRERMRIPVLHDDQHGTAICVGAAVRNGLELVDKRIEEVRLFCCGAGAAALACLDLLVSLGLKPENILVYDLDGIVHEGRQASMDPFKARYARRTSLRTLEEGIAGADVFLGLSGPGVLKPEHVARMAPRPLILALANPLPEILPEAAKAVRPDVLIATGRSDYPNQVNNVLCFPYLFRGALDVGATAINEAMKLAAVHAIADLAKAEASDIVLTAYGNRPLRFGPDYFIPAPFDPRLILWVASAVARAAMDSGVARRPIEDFDGYRQELTQYVYRTGFAMKPLFDRARADPKRVVYAEGEEEQVLRAVQIAVDEGLVRPVLVGRAGVVADKLHRMGLRLRPGSDVELLDPLDYPQYESYAARYHALMGRRGVSPDHAATLLHTRNTLIASMMVHAGDAEALICGTVGRFERHFRHVMDVIGLRSGVSDASALQLLILDEGSVFICDTAVTEAPTAEQIAEMTLLAAAHVEWFGMTPRVALLSHSDFGSAATPSALRMREALAILRREAPTLMVDGEMRADSALDPRVRQRSLPSAVLEGAANLLVMPSLDAANIGFNLAKALGNGIAVGPIMLGMAKPAHVVTPSITVRGLVNMTAVAVVDAQTVSAQAQAAGR